jgi:L-2-hydroxyglutarate oxidase LhgO
VSANEQAKLAQLQANARVCGVDKLQALDAHQIHPLEPAVHGVAGLLSSNTGIIDSHAYLQSLLAGAEQGGAQLVLHSPVEHLSRNGNAWLVEGHSQGEAFSLRAGQLLLAQQLVYQTEGCARN